MAKRGDAAHLVGRAGHSDVVLGDVVHAVVPSGVPSGVPSHGEAGQGGGTVAVPSGEVATPAGLVISAVDVLDSRRRAPRGVADGRFGAPNCGKSHPPKSSTTTRDEKEDNSGAPLCLRPALLPLFLLLPQVLLSCSG